MTIQAIQQAEHLLVELAHEMREGRGDDAKADKLRDALDIPLRQMTAAQRQLLEQLSADLYIVEGERLPEPLARGETLEDVMRQLTESFQEGKIREALAFARKMPTATPKLPSDVLAYFIGRCWDELRFTRAAVEFYDFAYAQNPRLHYAMLALDGLVRAGSAEEANARISAIEADQSAASALVLKAAVGLFQLTRSQEQPERDEAHRRVVELVARAEKDMSVLGSIRASAFLAAGFSCEHMGQAERGLEYFNLAVASFPTDAALVARGLALLERGRRDEAFADFRAAIARGTAIAWPYAYLARDAIVGGRWDEASRMTQAALGCSRIGALRARLLEWKAIAFANLGVDPSTVTSLFEEALIENPFDPIIVSNAAAYQRAIDETQHPAKWDLSAMINAKQARQSMSEQLLAA